MRILAKRQLKELVLYSLDLSRNCSRYAPKKGTLRAVAAETGSSVSTTSHHLQNLEGNLGVELINHARRSMVLTKKGGIFLRNIDGALLSTRSAKTEASAGNVIEASHLRIGSIEDFDGDITPDLAVYLSATMPHCDFSYRTNTSLDIFEMLRDRRLDLRFTTNPRWSARRITFRTAHCAVLSGCRLPCSSECPADLFRLRLVRTTRTTTVLTHICHDDPVNIR